MCDRCSNLPPHKRGKKLFRAQAGDSRENGAVSECAEFCRNMTLMFQRSSLFDVDRIEVSVIVECGSQVRWNKEFLM